MSSTQTSHRRRCPKCGALVSDAADGGLCPGCVLKGVMNVDTQADSLEGGLKSPESLLSQGELAGYSLLEEIGRGGMGVVFKARQSQPSRMVALKVIVAGELASPRMVARFQLEAKAAANLHHPNIVPIFEVGEDWGWHFFSMQLVEGPTLDKVIRALHSSGPNDGGSGPSSAGAAKQIAALIRDPRERMRLLLQIILAVHHAHQQGILHRDIKPANVLLNTEGKPFLTDFGLAKVLDEDTNLTLSAAVLGTPAYMAPEQASGSMKEVTVAADIYSLGAVMYELLAGVPPHVAPSARALLRKIEREDPLPPSSRLRQTASSKSRSSFFRSLGSSADLDVICLKCLEKEPYRRYASAGQVAEDLERWLKGETISARPARWTERAWKWARRNPARAGLVATLTLAGLVITSGSIAYNFQLNSLRVKAEQRAKENLETVVRQHGAAAAAFARRLDALNGLHSLATALHLSESFPEGKQEIEFRLGLMVALAPRPVAVWDAEGIPEKLNFSADGSQVLLNRRSAPPRVWRISDGTRVDPYTNSGLTVPGAEYRLSPDGRTVAEFRREAPFVTLRSVESGRSGILPVDEDTSAAFAFSEDSRSLFTGAGRLQQWDVEGMTEVPLARSIPGPITGIVAGGGGSVLILKHPGEVATLLTFPGLKEFATNVPCHNRFQMCEPFASRDGTLVAVSFEAEMRLCSADGPRLPGLLSHPGILFGGSFSPDGGVIASASFRGGVRLWDTRTGLTIPPQLDHENGGRCAVFSPDGQTLATGGFDHQARLWRRRNLKQWGATLPHDSLVRDVQFSPSGRFLATASASGLIRLWDTWAGEELISTARNSGPGWIVSDDRKAFLINTGPDRWRVGRFVGSNWTLGEPMDLPSNGAKVWDREGKRIAVGGPGEFVSVVDADSGRELQRVPTRCAPARLQFNPAGTRLAVAAGDGWVGTIALADGVEVKLAAADFASVGALGWSPDGNILMTGDGGRVRLWNAQGERFGQEVQRGGLVSQIRFSPAGRQAVVSYMDINTEPSSAVVIDLASGSALPGTLDHGDGVEDAVFSPDGSLIATAGQDNAARLWKADDRAPAGPTLRHEALVRAIAFSPDGRHIATGSHDYSLRLWELATGELAAPPLVFSSGVISIAFAPDASHLIAGCTDGSIWRVELPGLRASPEAWSRYASLATGHKLDPSGNVVRSSPAELVRTLGPRPAASSHPSLLAIPSPRQFTDEAWHLQEARMAEVSTNWFAAAFHWRKLIALGKDDPAVRENLKRAESELAR